MDKMYAEIVFETGIPILNPKDLIISLDTIEFMVPVPSQQKWTQKSFKKRNESQYFVNLLKPTAFIPRFA